MASQQKDVRLQDPTSETAKSAGAQAALKAAAAQAEGSGDRGPGRSHSRRIIERRRSPEPGLCLSRAPVIAVASAWGAAAAAHATARRGEEGRTRTSGCFRTSGAEDLGTTACAGDGRDHAEAAHHEGTAGGLQASEAGAATAGEHCTAAVGLRSASTGQGEEGTSGWLHAADAAAQGNGRPATSGEDAAALTSAGAPRIAAAGIGFSQP
jgi:hypothetical protein